MFACFLQDERFWMFFGIASGFLGLTWAILGVVLAFLNNLSSTRVSPAVTLLWLRVGLGVIGIGVLGLAVKVGTPLVLASTAKQAEATHAQLPAYDYAPWHQLAVQHDGREKPFESACAEVVRQVTGRTRFEKEMGGFKGHDPVAVVLSWMTLGGTSGGTSTTTWETYPFVLCDHHELRKLIYTDKTGDSARLTDEQLHGKYVAPADLRDSASFRKLLDELQEMRAKWGDKYSHHLSPEQRKAEEVATRLRVYDRIAQSGLVGHVAGTWGPRWAETTSLVLNPTLGLGTLAELYWNGRMLDRKIHDIAKRLEDDPFHLVGVDRVPGSAWFSLGELRAHLLDSTLWEEVMLDRLSRMPQLYLSADCKEALRQFQEQVKSGSAQETIEQMAAELPALSEERVAAFRQRFAGRDRVPEEDIIRDELLRNIPGEDRARIGARLRNVHEGEDGKLYVPILTNILREELDNRDQRIISELENQVRSAKAQGYHPEDPRFRMLHLNYLEGRFPDVYRRSIRDQAFPADRAREVLASFEGVREAYKTGDPELFQSATAAFLTTLRRTSDRTLAEGFAKHHDSNVQASYARVVETEKTGDPGQIDQALQEHIAAVQKTGEDVRPYPGVTTIPLEMRFNRVQPFMWAWVLMLVAMLGFCISLMTRSRIPYIVAFAAFFASLAFQVFGYYARVAISGRAPVSNMYETVIWVSSMSAVFALVLELIYRKRVIALAGAMVATLGLVLADQLPLVLDPKLSPLTPVLRSNYWLIIHVLTIVSSYAGGTLAWGLANISLAMIAFGKPSRDMLKTLSTYTYRAMQIAVLLLAAGTFLGGWWAAESWGRFWGWDPKEVWALIALVAYVIPLHMRYIGWIKDFGLAVSAVVCYASIVMAWYGVNFVLGAGLHSYGFGGGGPWWVFLAGLINLEWVLIAAAVHVKRTSASLSASQVDEPEAASV